MSKISSTKAYARFLSDIKERIRSAQYDALRAVNRELITLYWDIGRMIIIRQNKEGWGKAVVESLAMDLRREFPSLSGFSAQNLWRMKQFYEAYAPYPKLSTLLRELGWSGHLHILSKSKTIKEREFYLRLAVNERYTVRELERQIDSGSFERVVLSKEKVSPLALTSTCVPLHTSVYFCAPLPPLQPLCPSRDKLAMCPDTVRYSAW